MNKIFGYIPFLSVLALTSCQSGDSGVDGIRTVALRVAVERPGDINGTRTALNEDGDGNLKCGWLYSDTLTVTCGNHKLGTLTPVQGSIEETAGGGSHALFEGELMLHDELGSNPALTFVYAGNNPAVGDGKITMDFSNQAGTLAGLGNHDLLVSTVTASVSGETAYVENIGLKRSVAFVHFTATGVGIPEGGLTVTVSGANLGNAATVSYAGGVTVAEGNITITTDASGDFYLSIPLADDETAISPVFTATVNGTDYTCTRERTKAWTRGEYVRGEEGKGIPVEFAEVPKVDDGTMGPTFEYGGKKYRFTKGNLYYNTVTKQWGLYDKCTYFDNAAQTITCKGAYSHTVVTPEIIDHFSWGGTGLENGRSPEFTFDQNNHRTQITGRYWPSMDQNINVSITDLHANDHVFDWGRAYKEDGRAEGDKRDYITPPLSIYSQVFDTTKAFIQGCTVKGAGKNNEDVYGLIIIYKKLSLAEAKVYINDVEGAKALSTMSTILHNNNGNTCNYKNIVLDSYEVLDRFPDEVLFFAAAGRHNWNYCTNTTSASATCSQVNTKDVGQYWTSTGMQGSSQGANARSMDFAGLSGTHYFYYGSNIGYQNSKGREQKLSVRLLVEVDD